jgi:PIN domain nuclease of toxin-antitoxin system
MSGDASYLLDSHVLLWWWFDPDRLSSAVRELLGDPATPVRVSAATGRELSLKHHQGKLPELSGAIADLPGLLKSLPHRDPFDRMLAAQAELDRLVLLTVDPQMSTFPCQTLW